LIPTPGAVFIEETVDEIHLHLEVPGIHGVSGLGLVGPVRAQVA
jgi:hypothetical protein